MAGLSRASKHLNLPSAGFLLAAGALFTGAAAQDGPVTTVAVHDTFPTGAVRDDDAADALDIPWFTNTTGAGPDLLIDTVLGPAGNRILRYRPYGTNRAMIGTLYGGTGDVPAAVMLGDEVGNQIRLSFDFRRAETGDAYLLFGLHRSPGGTQTTASHVNYTTSGHSSADDAGYFARIGINANSAADLGKESGTNGGLLAGTDLVMFGGTGTPVSITGSSSGPKYSGVLTLSRTSTGVDLGFSVLDAAGDTIGGATASDTAAPYLAFDAITFGTSGNGDGVRLDNIVLETTIVPEPMTAAVFGLVVIGMLQRRSRAGL